MESLRRPSRVVLSVFVLLAVAVVGSLSAQATTMTIVNIDGAGEGLNDPAGVSPVGGNLGTTLGDQRLKALQFAADFWAKLIDSAVEIRIRAQFNPLSCSATSAVLGQAGAVTVHGNFTGAPRADTWYPVALANALHGADLNPGGDDVNATFTSALDDGSCAFPKSFYYGLDGNAPSTQTDFVTVALHELGHALGFSTTVNLATGAKLAGCDSGNLSQGCDDTYMVNLEDHSTTKSYPDMTDAERVTASINTGNLHWVGANVKAASAVLTAGVDVDHVQMYAPATQEPGSSVSHWAKTLAPDELMEPVFTGTLHDVGLALQVMQDLGWPLVSGPRINVAPSTFNYGSVATGNFSDKVFVVRNTGTSTLHVTSTDTLGTDAAQFVIQGGVDAFDLAPNTTQSVTVRFAPTGTAGSRSATLRFTSDDPNTPDKDISLNGTAVVPAPTISVTPSSFNYGSVTVGSFSDKIFTVKNVGNATLHVASSQTTGTNPAQFVIQGGVNAFDLAPNATQTVTVRFSPAAPAGAKTATLQFTSDDPVTPTKTVALSGTAFIPVHDLAVVKIQAPATVTVVAGTPVTKSVKVQVQNRSNHNEVLANDLVLGDGTGSGLVQLGITLLDVDEGCVSTPPVLDTAKNATLFKNGPKVWKSKAKLTINYLVTYNCASPLKGTLGTTADYSYTASVHHDAIAPEADSHPEDDACPHDALATVGHLDPNPDGKIVDKGCGAKKPDGTLGNPVRTNVLKK